MWRASPVRNGTVSACYKRFYERITYRLGFTFRLEGKHVLALSAVGIAGGKGANRKFLGLESIGPRLSSYLFFRTGIPKKISAAVTRAPTAVRADQVL